MANRHEIWELRQMQALPPEDGYLILREVAGADMTLDKKIEQLRGTQERAEKYAPEGVDGMEARALRALGEDSKRLADWLEELKRYKDIEEQGRLVVLPEREWNGGIENDEGSDR